MDYERNYQPSANHLAVTSLTVSDTAVDSGTLAAGYWYQILSTVDARIKVGTTAVTTSEFLPAYEWSPPYRCHVATEVFSVIRDGAVSGEAHVRCRKTDV